MPRKRPAPPTTPDLPPLKLVSVQEAADRYNVTTRTIRRRITDGTIVGYRIGGTRAPIRVDLHECENKLVQRIGRADDRPLA